MTHRIGIDLGGTKTEIIMLDESGKMLLRNRIPTNRDNYPEIIRDIVSLIETTEKQFTGKTTIGISMPGALSTENGRVKNSNTVCMNGQDFKKDMETALQRPVRISNDANCFTLSEAVDGAGMGADVVFGVILGTGVGGGITIGGRILQGINAIAGEWGHNSLPWPNQEELPGPQCYCGRRGCIETFLSGPGLMQDYQNCPGNTFKPADIVAKRMEGDPHAIDVLQRYTDRLARALANVINIIDPDVIVLGGGLSNIDTLYEEVPVIWKPYVFSDRIDTSIKKAVHGDSSGVRGAAWLWPA